MSPEQEKEARIKQDLDKALGLILEAHQLAMELDYGGDILERFRAAGYAVRDVSEDLS
jgi:hypothetical protein